MRHRRQWLRQVHEFPEDKWDAIIAVCLSSAFHTTKAALPHMLRQNWGRIINTGTHTLLLMFHHSMTRGLDVQMTCRLVPQASLVQRNVWMSRTAQRCCVPSLRHI